MKARRYTVIFALISASLTSPCSIAVEPISNESGGVLERLSGLTDRAAQLAIEAMSLIGIHYRRGGNSPENGLDCSGLVRYVFKQTNDIDLPRTSVEMSRVGEQVDK
ncbi:MAG: C40 family peptidase, partial [Burkholderiaceae bacterium]